MKIWYCMLNALHEEREQRLTKQWNKLKSRLLSSQSFSTKKNQPCKADKTLKSNQTNTQQQELRETDEAVPSTTTIHDINPVRTTGARYRPLYATAMGIVTTSDRNCASLTEPRCTTLPNDQC